MKKFLALALILTLALALSISSFAFTIGGSDGTDSFDPSDSPANVAVKVTVGGIHHKYAVDIDYTDITLSIDGSDLTWDPKNLEYVTNEDYAGGLGTATSQVTITNYSDQSIFVKPIIDDRDANDFLEVVTDVTTKTEVVKAKAASAKNAGDGQATVQLINITVQPESTWKAVADYYTPKLTGNTNTIIAAVVTIQITKD